MYFFNSPDHFLLILSFANNLVPDQARQSPAPRLMCVPENYVLIPQPKHILWVLKRTVLMGRLFKHPKCMFKLMIENNFKRLYVQNFA